MKNNTDFTCDYLLQVNEKFSANFNKNSLMQLMINSKMADKKIRERLLDCIQVFSDYFQKTVMLRYLFCDNSQFLPVTQIHLQEEFMHNISLSADRNHRPAIWDAVLEATASWFAWKMFTLDQEEKTVLLHLVLETSANIFFNAAHKIMASYGETNYFAIHAEVDENHEKMGTELLQSLSAKKYQRLLEVQAQGWDMINTICNRIATLSEESLSVRETSCAL